MERGDEAPMDPTESTGDETDKGKAPGQDNADDEHGQHAETHNNFQFLTFTDFSQTTDPRTKKKVRSHVMQRVHRTMRSSGRPHKEGVIALDLSLLLAQSQQRADALIPSPSTLGAGRSDPFANYPIPMNARTHILFDHLQGPTCPILKTLNRIGFFQTLSDPAGFRQMLCTAACHMGALSQAGEPQDAIVLSTQALQSVNSRITDPTESKSEGMLTAVMAFCCHSIMFGDRPASVTHFKGLEEMIKLRGGVESLDLNPVLRLMIFWADTNVAFTEDRLPKYSIPYHILSRYILEPPPNMLIPMKLAEVCTTEDMVSAMKDLYGQNYLLVEEVLPRSGWIDGVFANLNLMPVLYRFLSIRYDVFTPNPDVIRHITYRSGAILYITAIRNQHGIKFSEELHVDKLQAALIALEERNIDCDPSILLWLLVIGGTRSVTTQQHVWFVSKLAQVIKLMDFTSWEQLTSQVQAVLWADGLSLGECELLRGELSVEAMDSYGHSFA